MPGPTMKSSILISFICLTGCASAPLALQFQNQPRVQIQPEKALVFVYMDESALWGQKIKIYDGTKQLGVITSGSYTYFFVAPGKHQLSVSTPLSTMEWIYGDSLNAGESYYLTPIASCFFFFCSTDLNAIDPRTAQDDMAELKFAGAGTDP